MNEYDEYDAEQDDVMQEVRDEVMEYADNVHRAEEDGWFYPDDDGECE